MKKVLTQKENHGIFEIERHIQLLERGASAMKNPWGNLPGGVRNGLVPLFADEVRYHLIIIS